MDGAIFGECMVVFNLSPISPLPPCERVVVIAAAAAAVVVDDNCNFKLAPSASSLLQKNSK